MDMTRRETLSRVGGVVLAAGIAPLVSSCAGIVRSDAASDSSIPGLDPALVDILNLAALAPSGHNTQPWVVRVPEPNRLFIGTARERWLPQVDPENRELLLSLGCFMENLTIAAKHRGLDVEYRFVAAAPTDNNILEVMLRRTEPSPYVLEKLAQRRTVRSDHLDRALTTTDIKALSEPFGGRSAFFPAASPEGRWLAENTIEANRVQAYRDPAQEELSRWIRWSDKDALKHRNGLTPESMEITGLDGWYVRHFMNASSAMKSSFRDRGVEVVRAHVSSYGGWLVITSPDGSIPTLIETGRLVERMWLGIRERMIAIHPMTQILEEAPFRDQVAQQLGLSGPVQFLLRTSYLERYPDPVSMRMPVSRFAGTNG